MKAFLLASIAAHILLLGILFITVKLPKPLPVETVVVEMVPSKAPRAAKSKRGAKLLSMQSLLPTLSTSGLKSGRASSSDWQAEDWGSGGNDLTQAASMNELQRLMEELNGMFNFPGAFQKRKISGTVSARLFFKSSGGCDWERSKIYPGEAHFRVYVLAMLKKVCGFGQIERMRLNATDHADLSFQLLFVPPGQVNFSPTPWMTGNVLAFERQAGSSPIAIPLGPIRLFDGDIAHVDFGWFFDQWDALVGKKDPLAAFQ